MSKKPSERILEIVNKLKENPFAYPYETDVDVALTHISAIQQFLDEQHEKNRPCEHKSSYQVDTTGDVYYNVCNDCGVLFLAQDKETK